LDEQLLSQQTKDLTLEFLQKIGAKVVESDGLFTIDLPSEFEQTFGSTQKRIAFESEIASTHSCEFVIMGSNFLSIVLNEIKKQASVIGGSLKQNGQFHQNVLDSVSIHNGTVNFVDSIKKSKTVIRFYFNIQLKSIKNNSVLKYIDIDSDNFNQVTFPEELELETSVDEINFENLKTVDHCYDKAITSLQEKISQLIDEHSNSTKDDLKQDLGSLEISHNKKLYEINQEIDVLKSKLHEYDDKISRAKTYVTRAKYRDQKIKHVERINNEKQKASIQIKKLKNDKNNYEQQIQKRYTPIVNSTLIASQVFSYNIEKCTLEIKNPFSKNTTIGEYDEFSKKFIILCENCTINSAHIHLCVNGHVGCNVCTKQCTSCEKDVCQKCTDQLGSCVICTEKTCNSCSSTCYSCNHTSCPKHLISCSITDQVYCTNDSLKCSTCEQTYSKDHVSDKQCKTCKNLSNVDSNDSRVLEIIQLNSEFDKYKKWEYSTNSKFEVFFAKKTFSKKIIVYDKEEKKIIINKKHGWL
jgi:hypothetical protein